MMNNLSEYPAYKRLDLPVVGATGEYLVLASGRRVLDLYGGHCVNTLGAGASQLGTAIAEQWQTLSFTTNLLETPTRARFMETVAPTLPAGDWRLFCSNSGAEANENALKLALAAAGAGRERVVCFKGAFHGRTAAAAAVSDGPASGFPRAPFPVQRLEWGSLAIPKDAAVVMVEPIQSLAGVIEPPDCWLTSLRAACARVGALLVFDEVQTASGRLGSPWASTHFGVTPDVFTTAKGAAGGLPIGLTFVSAELAEKVPAGLVGSTFGGGPLALAAASVVWQRVASGELPENARACEAALRAAVAAHPQGPVRAVRGAGLLLGLELEASLTAAAARAALLAEDILVGTCNDPQILRLSPALTVAPESVARVIEILARLFQPSTSLSGSSA
ncbi:MAG TPA: aminotransferase class III-fold pyridoxal phosphate-dependent enzyme [Planctomycetota bacterium]|jgi:acetylornithine/succinyldiaminopimelate/putrescine aminotransferase|nr:aminotransferase class III-fold pyridoxal phosphate-dependent enzyme [Planctomycetota bacterium]